MKIIKALFFPVFLPLILFISAGRPDRANSGSPPLTWDLGLLHVQSDETLDFAAVVQSATGERFRIVIIPRADCFVYVIYENAADASADIAVIHSGGLRGDEISLSGILELQAPGGTERFYIVVSREEQMYLSGLIAELEENPAAGHKTALLHEVARIQEDAAKKQEAPPRPVYLGGTLRGRTGKNAGMEYSGLHTYVKTIIISH